MAASTGFVGKGTVVRLNFGAGMVAVANVVGVNINGRSVEEVDFTHLGSTGGYRENRAGFIDPGNLGLTLHFDPTHSTHGSIEAALGGANITWEVDFAGAGKGRKMSGDGYVSGNDISVGVSDPVGAEATLRLSGPITISASP